MKQTLLKTMALGLLFLGAGSTAWADNNTSYAVYNETSGTGYTSLSDAISGATDETATTLYINSDITLSAGIDFNSTTNTKKLITLLPGKDNVVIKSGITGRIFTVNSNTASLKIGGGDYHLIIDGDNKSYGSGFISIENDKGKADNNERGLFLNNVTIKNVKVTGNDGSGYVYQRKNSGHDQNLFKNVTFENCQVTGTGSVGIVRYLRQSVLYLEGAINFSNCSGPSFYLDNTKCVLRNNGSNLTDMTLTNPITVSINTSSFTLGQNVLVKFSEDAAGKTTLTTDNRGLFFKSNGDVKLCEAYTLEVGDAKAATLILPFASKIPADASVYTLTYTAGVSAVTATAVETTLAANTPVLVNAAEGKYKFVASTEPQTNATATTGSGTHTSGALTGVYEETTITTGHYILTNHEGKVGFRKTVTTSKVAANRAYLTAGSGSGAPKFLAINFGDNGTTAVEAVTVKHAEDGVYYNLSGQRIVNPKRGLYIVNGKKVVVK